MTASARPSGLRLVGGIAAATLAALAFVGCVPEPEAGEPVGQQTTAPASPSATPTQSATTPAQLELPQTCGELYSEQMLATLDATLPVSNDPAVTLYSTQIVGALEVLESGIPTLRCTWTSPDGPGLSTNVSIVDEPASGVVAGALEASGFSCEEVEGGTMCRIESETVDLDANPVTQGEVHYQRDNVWITTAWINTLPEGYTEDIVATLWS